MIVSQIQKSVDNGVVEVALLGQNVNSYGKRFSDKEINIAFTNFFKIFQK
jgi:tRNA-2-methylthio-N6-dimethylallyladenosine synthase